MKIARCCVACDGKNLTKSPAVLVPFIALRVFGWETAVVDDTWRLRDIPKGNTLSACNSVACDDCGMLFLDMRFDDEEMSALYSNYRDPAYTAMREGFEPGYSIRNALLRDGHGYLNEIECFIEPHLPVAPRILDWGGDSGRNTPFRGRASVHHIYDISGQPVIEGAVAVGLELVRATAYDLIVFSNVLEHVPSPTATLTEIAGAMQDGTLLYLEVPHEEVMRSMGGPQERRERKRHWHEHINFFSETSLDRVFVQAGLHILERQSRQVSVAGRDVFVFSILARLG